MISIDELADFTLRINALVDSLKKRVQELEAENKALKDKSAPKE